MTQQTDGRSIAITMLPISERRSSEQQDKASAGSWRVFFQKKYMIGLISRLTDQKGLDLINHVIEGIVDDFTQLVVIGTGDPQYENMFRHYAWKYPDRVSSKYLLLR